VVIVDTSVWIDFPRGANAGKNSLSGVDCLIGQIAIEHGLMLLHDDRDFEVIAASVPQLRLYQAG